jgi:hypothetical protein
MQVWVNCYKYLPSARVVVGKLAKNKSKNLHLLGTKMNLKVKVWGITQIINFQKHISICTELKKFLVRGNLV